MRLPVAVGRLEGRGVTDGPADTDGLSDGRSSDAWGGGGGTGAAWPIPRCGDRGGIQHFPTSQSPQNSFCATIISKATPI